MSDDGTTRRRDQSTIDLRPVKVVSGELPSGRLHLGHLFGTLEARVDLQRAGAGTFVVLADHQIALGRFPPQVLQQHVQDAVLDYFAAGLDPTSTAVFVHSAVPALHQLFLPLLGLTSTDELPPILGARSESTALLLTSQVHQAADILALGADQVPVGLDNEPHVLFAATLAERFNDRFGTTLTVPRAVLTSSPVVPGLDGQKMSKSRGNAIELAMTEDETATTIRNAPLLDGPLASSEVSSSVAIAMVTLAAHCLGETPADRLTAWRPTTGRALKLELTDVVNSRLAEHRTRRRHLAAEPQLPHASLTRGAQQANAVAEQTLSAVRDALGCIY